MGFRSTALFQCLETDVGPHLTAYQLREIAAGRLKEPWPDANPTQAACQMLLQSVDKKLVDEIKEDAEAKALVKFLQVNEACRTWKLELEGSWDEELFGTFKKVLSDFFSPGGYPLLDSFDEIFSSGRLGPGASIGARGNDFYTKLFSSRLSSTKADLYKAYRHYIRRFPDWLNAEILRRELYGECDVVEGNRVSFVPKSNEISRTICTEPSLNMFCQLGVEQILSKRLKSFFGIDLTNQQVRNRDLARIGSLAGVMSTIDLSSASDSISMSMLKECMPSSQLDWLTLFRCSKSTLPTGDSVDLNMVSTMGNGYTFVLQCAIFASVVSASFRCRGVSPLCQWNDKTVKNWGVNGDDIIVPREITGDVLRLLKILGFTVNASKTFVEGPFRESCGGDFFMGHDVRGVYLKSLDSLQSRYVAINMLNSWSCKTGVSLSNTVQYLLSTVRYQPVPIWENADAGIWVPYSFIRGSADVDYSQGSVLYRRELRRTARLTVDGLRVKVPAGQRRRIYNPWGLLLCFLRGDIVDGRIGVSHDAVPYVTKRALAPSWEHRPTDFKPEYLVDAGPGRKAWNSVHWADPLKFDAQRYNDAAWFNFFG